MYEEINEFLSTLTETEKKRVIFKFVLGLSTQEICEFENCSRQSVSIVLLRAEEKFGKFKKHDELMDLIQRMFTP